MTTTSDVLGLVGVVVTRVRGTAGPGEIRVVHRGLAHTFIAHAEQEVPVGTHVLVISARGGRQVDVEPWQLHTQLDTQLDTQLHTQLHANHPAGANGQQERS